VVEATPDSLHILACEYAHVSSVVDDLDLFACELVQAVHQLVDLLVGGLDLALVEVLVGGDGGGGCSTRELGCPSQCPFSAFEDSICENMAPILRTTAPLCMSPTILTVKRALKSSVPSGA